MNPEMILSLAAEDPALRTQREAGFSPPNSGCRHSRRRRFRQPC